jgi:hypothetical protein
MRWREMKSDGREMERERKQEDEWMVGEDER